MVVYKKRCNEKCYNVYIDNGSSIWVTANDVEGFSVGIPEPKCTRTCNLHKDCPGFEADDIMCLNGVCVEKICPLSFENGGVHLLSNGTKGTSFGSSAIITCLYEKPRRKL